MELGTISDMILRNDMVLNAQPKWTFGKNSCNTYEVRVAYFKGADGHLIPAMPIIEIIEKDAALTMLFSITFLREAVRKTVEISNRVSTNLTVSLNILPKFAESEYFVEQVKTCLQDYGLEARRLQFEVSEMQDLNDDGCRNLNTVHDEMGVLLMMGNFGTRHSNIPLLYKVHFDGLELDDSYAARIPEDELTCKIAIAIQHMAHTIDMNLCAKGIDNQDQFEFFEEIGAYKGQGNLIGSTMSLEEMENYVKLYALPRGHK